MRLKYGNPGFKKIKPKKGKYIAQDMDNGMITKYMENIKEKYNLRYEKRKDIA